ncbi:hypothetical protein GCM10017673_42970 [Streptosporangium violaceochromogenes]|nr:hypothetical protein GCM10017673_42970 [Streptosporangium violaceochromogenes]
MPKFKSVLAGLAISTALSGGVVALGAATTATSATAGTATTGISSFQTSWGWNTCGCWRRRGCRGWGWGCCHRRHHHRRLVVVNTNNVGAGGGGGGGGGAARNFNDDGERERRP